MNHSPKFLNKILLALFLLISAGCDSTQNHTVQSPPPWKLEDFEQADTLLMAITRAQLKFSESRIILASHENTIEILVDSSEQFLKKGETWAKYDLAILKDQIQKTTERIEHVEQEIRKKLEIDIPLQLLELNTGILQAEEALQLKSQIDQNQDLANNPLLNNALGQKLSINTSPEQIRLLKKQKTYLESIQDTPPPELQNQLDTLKEEKRKLEQCLDEATLTMPYDGPLHIQLPEFRGSGKYPVSPQQPIAQMENSGSLLFYLDASTTSHFLSGNSSADLVLKHQIPGQEPTFSESAGDQILRINNQRQRFLTFAPTKPDDYFEKADSFQRVEILQNLDRTCHIVPKMSLLAYNQSNQTPDWQNLLQTLQPDFKVIAEGPGTLAIAPARN